MVAVEAAAPARERMRILLEVRDGRSSNFTHAFMCGRDGVKIFGGSRMNKRVLIAALLTIAVLSFGLYWSLRFSMELVPDTMSAIPGQMCVFLVSVDGGIGKVEILASAPDSTVSVEPQAITSEQVSEITVTPQKFGTQTLTVRGNRAGLQQAKTATLEVLELVVDGEDPLGAYATEIRDRFIPWLAANHPEFGITSSTEWTGTIVRPNFMVVMFYLFFSDDWEMGVSWHVMIPPYDWARIYLRHRFTEVSPSYAFEISSLEAQEEPHAINLADAFAESVWR